jgi:aldehyde reductase
MEKQVEQKKARAIGVSNFNAEQIQRILNHCEIPPENLQVEIHAYMQQRQLRKMCSDNGITVCAYGPLGSPGRFQLYTKNNVS